MQTLTHLSTTKMHESAYNRTPHFHKQRIDKNIARALLHLSETGKIQHYQLCRHNRIRIFILVSLFQFCLCQHHAQKLYGGTVYILKLEKVD